MTINGDNHATVAVGATSAGRATAAQASRRARPPTREQVLGIHRDA